MKMTKVALFTAAILGFAVQAAPTLTIENEASGKKDSLALIVTASELAKAEGVLADPAVQHAVKAAEFKASAGATLELLAPVAGYNRVVLLGAGEAEKLTPFKAAELGASLAAYLSKSPTTHLTVDTNAVTPSFGQANWVAQLAHGFELRSYSFTKYKSDKKSEKKQTVEFISGDEEAAERAYEKTHAISQGVFLARDLVNEPGDDLSPAVFAEQAKKLSKLGVKVQVLDVAAMEKLGMGAILAVGKGSSKPPRLVIAHWKGSNQQPLAIVGKGVTFDTGGYNVKTGNSMMNMTSDMAGAAAALGTIKALALQKAPVNVVAVMAMAENAISGNAMLPGDVIRSASGKTIQIVNTDAEGRLVLADALWYANKEYQPRAMVDIATLTGAKVGAVGTYYAGLFSEHPELAQQLTNAGEKVQEPLWRLPLGSQYKKDMQSTIADLVNSGAGTGASTAAWFLQQFVGETPWAHLDIAGNALTQAEKDVHVKGATGYGVRLLTEWATTQP